MKLSRKFIKTRKVVVATLLFCIVFIILVSAGRAVTNTNQNEKHYYDDGNRRNRIMAGVSGAVSLAGSESVAGVSNAASAQQHEKASSNLIRIIPKTIFSFWNSLPTPHIIENMINTWVRENTDYDIVLLTFDNLANYLDLENTTPLPRNFNTLSSQFQADWIRLAVLLLHGGIWVDASFVMLQSLDFINEIVEKEGTDGFMYHLPGWTRLPEFPYYENWLIAAGNIVDLLSKLKHKPIYSNLLTTHSSKRCFYKIMVPRIQLHSRTSQAKRHLSGPLEINSRFGEILFDSSRKPHARLPKTAHGLAENSANRLCPPSPLHPFSNSIPLRPIKPSRFSSLEIPRSSLIPYPSLSPSLSPNTISNSRQSSPFHQTTQRRTRISRTPNHSLFPFLLYPL